MESIGGYGDPKYFLKGEAGAALSSKNISKIKLER
jgi:hypothetical protein